ncbi:hypothetical protein [Pantoea ananatis]|uniref:hypothetical protein n=1 Tax=Pantoea ananas TaxID=553 RepID=UPI0003825923|nr:hypothetical protein [Pantoea ananatis]
MADISPSKVHYLYDVLLPAALEFKKLQGMDSVAMNAISRGSKHRIVFVGGAKKAMKSLNAAWVEHCKVAGLNNDNSLEYRDQP